MPGPVQRCDTCGDVQAVMPDGRGFPPNIAKNKLAKRCKAKGHSCVPKYTAGFYFRPPQSREVPDPLVTGLKSEILLRCHRINPSVSLDDVMEVSDLLDRLVEAVRSESSE